MPKLDTKDVDRALKLCANLNITVRVPKRDADGVPVRDPETQKFVTEDLPLDAEHILGLRDEGDALVVITVDGKKHRAAKPAGK